MKTIIHALAVVVLWCTATLSSAQSVSRLMPVPAPADHCLVLLEEGTTVENLGYVDAHSAYLKVRVLSGEHAGRQGYIIDLAVTRDNKIHGIGTVEGYAANVQLKQTDIPVDFNNPSDSIKKLLTLMGISS